jgi:Ni,Fe-hydrogenase I cytochrome b subunit
LTLSWIRSMHLNFQKVCNFLLQFRLFKFCNIFVKNKNKKRILDILARINNSCEAV